MSKINDNPNTFQIYFKYKSIYHFDLFCSVGDNKYQQNECIEIIIYFILACSF